jgi:hypothetical protein
MIIFIPQNENQSCINKKNLNMSKKDAATAEVLNNGTSDKSNAALKTTLEEDGKQKKRKVCT